MFALLSISLRDNYENFEIFKSVVDPFIVFIRNFVEIWRILYIFYACVK